MSAFTKKELESFDENLAEKKLNPKVQGGKIIPPRHAKLG